MDLMASKKQNPAQPESQYESFESFWDDFAQNRVVPTVDILGVDVPVPHDVSLGLQQRVFTANGEDVDGMVELMEQMFGEEILEQLMEAGVTGDQMVIILAWGVMNGSGEKVTFREAAERFYANAEEKQKQDPPKLAAVKKASSTRKRSTSSRRTGGS